MIVVTSQLQRKITLHGIDDCTKLATNTSGNLKRLNASPRESDSVLNRLGVLKAEVEKIAPIEEGQAAIEIHPHTARVWVTVLQAYARRVTRVVRSATQIDMQLPTDDYQAEAEKLNAQLHEQLDLPVQTLESIVAQDGKDAEPAAAPDAGVGPDSQMPADPRSRRGPKLVKTDSEPPAAAADDDWDQGHRDGPANTGDVAPVGGD